MTAMAFNSRWRIIACDLDGTLIGWNHKINDRDLDALRSARDAGFHVAICTGRTSLECAGIIASLGLQGLGVFANGSMVCDMADGRARHCTYMPDGLAEETIDYVGQGAADEQAGDAGKIHRHAVLVLAEDPITRLPAYCLTDHAPPHSATIDWLVVNRVHATPVEDIPLELRGRIVRLGVVVNVEEAPGLHARLIRRFDGRCATHSIYSPHYDCRIIEVFHPQANKWTGLVHLAEALNMPADGILTIGDDINDLAMLRQAELSFAMASATPEVQAHAKRITASQADCGVARVIDDLLAGSLE